MPAMARTPPLIVTFLGVVTAALVVLPRMGGAVGERATSVSLTFVALVVESLPFLLAGAALAALVERYALSRILASPGRHPRLAVLLAPFTGVALPLCDCGLVPLARGLNDRGASPGVVNGFLAGAPLTNPIVVLSTVVAFPGRPDMVVGRVVVGLVVAQLVALLAPQPQRRVSPSTVHDRTSLPIVHEHDPTPRKPGLTAAIASEFAHTAPTLIAGALLAATIKAMIPTETLIALARQPLAGAVALMCLAFVMAICSQADAFVAGALPVGTLPRLAFLVMGPMLDVRLAAIYRREFGDRWLAGYAAAAVPAVLVVATVWVTWSPL